MPKREAAALHYKTVGRTSDGVTILKPKMSSPKLKKLETIVRASMAAHKVAPTSKTKMARGKK